MSLSSDQCSAFSELRIQSVEQFGAQSLGNIACKERRFAEAKKYYAKAAGHQGDAGKAAFGSLVELDLADIPDKYIGLRIGVDKKGRVLADIKKPTPRDITGLVIALQ